MKSQTISHSCTEVNNLYLFSCEVVPVDHLTVHVGDWNRNGIDIGEFSVQAQEMIMHENYGAVNGISNDICLLKVPTLMNQKFGFN